MLHVWRAGIHELAGDSGGSAVLLKLHAEVRGVRGILLILAERRSDRVDQVNGRIAFRDQRVGRVLGDPGQDRVPLGQKFVELRQIFRRVTRESEGASGVATRWAGEIGAGVGSGAKAGSEVETGVGVGATAAAIASAEAVPSPA